MTAFDDIADDFEFLDDWEDRYRYVIDLGKKMPPMDAGLQGPETKVDGCASQVWIAPTVTGSGPDATISFVGASDAMIVQGLIAVLSALYNNRSAGDILATDAFEKFAVLGLDQHLSAQRSNGLRAMVGRIREIASRASTAA